MLVGGVAQWSGRQSLAGGLSRTYAWSIVDEWPLTDHSMGKLSNQANSAFHLSGVSKLRGGDHQTADQGCVWLFDCGSKSVGVSLDCDLQTVRPLCLWHKSAAAAAVCGLWRYIGLNVAYAYIADCLLTNKYTTYVRLNTVTRLVYWLRRVTWTAYRSWCNFYYYYSHIYTTARGTLTNKTPPMRSVEYSSNKNKKLKLSNCVRKLQQQISFYRKGITRGGIIPRQ